MAFHRGQTGYVTLGGRLIGAPLVNGARALGQSSLNLDGAPLLGAVCVGDQFTIAGEAGSPVHTVTGGPFYIAAANAIANLQFTPALAGAVADNAAITFVSNVVAQTTGWSLNVDAEELETTCQGDDWKTFMGGVASWNGQLTARLDYGDPRQKALIDKLIAGTPAAAIAALTFGVEAKAAGPAGIRYFHGAAVLRNLAIASQMGQIVAVTAGFTGSGALQPQWN